MRNESGLTKRNQFDEQNHSIIVLKLAINIHTRKYIFFITHIHTHIHIYIAYTIHTHRYRDIYTHTGCPVYLEKLENLVGDWTSHFFLQIFLLCKDTSYVANIFCRYSKGNFQTHFTKKTKHISFYRSTTFAQTDTTHCHMKPFLTIKSNKLYHKFART